MARLTVGLDCEYRGVQPGGEFEDRQEPGKMISYGPKLKFESESPDGDVSLIALRGSDLDKCVPPFDHTQLVKGDRLRMTVLIVVGERDGDRSYFQPLSVEYADASVKPVKVA